MIPYKHEPFTDFSQEANYNAYVEALNKVEGYLGQDYPLIIGGERITTEDKIVSYNPAKKTEVINKRSWETMGRGRCRYSGSNRLLGILWSPNATH